MERPNLTGVRMDVAFYIATLEADAAHKQERLNKQEEEISKLKSICPNYKAYSASCKDDAYIFLVGKDVMHIRYSADSFPHVLKGNDADPLWYGMLNKRYERKEISTDDVCKRLDGIVRGNRRYYKETVVKVKKWFNDCVKLAEERNT